MNNDTYVSGTNAGKLAQIVVIIDEMADLMMTSDYGDLPAPTAQMVRRSHDISGIAARFLWVDFMKQKAYRKRKAGNASEKKRKQKKVTPVVTQSEKRQR